MRIDDGVGSDIEITLLDKSDGIWVSVSGEIDASNASAFAAGLQAAIAEPGRPIVLDLAEVTFMDSSGIRELMSARQSVGPRLRIAALHQSVRRILELSSLLDQLEACADSDTSSAALDAPSAGLPVNDA